MSRAALTSVLLARPCGATGCAMRCLYLQVTRGTAPRNHVYPKRGAAVARRDRAPSRAFPARGEREEGVGVITLPDLRWGRCDIKSISLLPNVMARQQAAAAGCREAWLVDQAGRVTEGSASNAYIVDQDGRLVTPPLSPSDPRRRHPLGRPGARARRRHRGGRAAVLAGGGAGRRARRRCPAPARCCCRSPRSTTARSATAIPAA